jgi:DNA polymerase III subunit gamma/tau
MSATFSDWSELYRPQRFEEVLGQSIPCGYLGGLVLNRKRRDNILLFGDVGSGKTSLAKIYARALNCAAPDERSGSPCLQCEYCLGKGENLYEYDVPLRGGDIASVAKFVQWSADRGQPGRPHVVFFDEAQSLSDRACLYLLKRLETAHTNSTAPAFVFATTAPLKLKAALLSRLKRLHVRALDVDEAYALLDGVARSEGIAVEPGALNLVMRYAGRQPRDLLAAMQVATDHPAKVLRIADAKEAFGYDQIDDLEDYFVALGSGDHAAMTDIFERWRLPLADRIEWIEAYLTSFYLRTMNGLSVSVDAVVDSLTAKRERVAAAFLQRLGLNRLAELAPTWRAMMQFWAEPVELRSEAAYALRIALFHERCQQGDWVPSFPRATSRQAIAAPPSAWGQGDAVAIGETGYLGSAQVRNIFNGASFLVQRTGAHLNLLLRVTPPDGRTGNDAAAVSYVDEVVVALEQELAGYLEDSAAEISAIRVAENTDHGPVGYIAAHLPTEAHPDDGPLSPLRAIDDWAHACLGVQVIVGADNRATHNSTHWRIVRELVAGFSDTDVEAPTSSLRSRLKLGTLRTPSRLRGELVRFWGMAISTAIAQHDGDPSPLQSKFDAGLLEEIDSGWEIAEFNRRSIQVSINGYTDA